MKYYTKEWYALMQCVDSLDSFQKIADGEYTTASIKALYDKKLKAMIASEKRGYNQEPFFPVSEEDLTEDTFDADDWIFVEEESGQVKKPASLQEVREHLEAERQKAYEEFENRAPFDPSETIELFQTSYRMNLRACKKIYPAWLTQSVDHRLIALECLPESAYMRYRNELRETKKRWNAINKAAEKDLRRQNIPEQMDEALSLHDASLLSIRKQGSHIAMTVTKDGLWPDDATPYRKVVFKDAEILEKERGLIARKYREGNVYHSNVSFLYYELYQKDGKYEVHMMFDFAGKLRYFTVKCRDILYIDGLNV